MVAACTLLECDPAQQVFFSFVFVKLPLAAPFCPGLASLCFVPFCFNSFPRKKQEEPDFE